MGKVYAVFWILIGITMCSMFTATLTSEIISARAPANTDVAGNDVAVMKGRAHDIQIVAEKGAVIHMGTIGRTMKGIDEMINLLQNGTVSGFIVDRNTHYHVTQRINNSKKYKHIKEKLEKMDMVRTEKQHDQQTLSCGMLIRNLNALISHKVLTKSYKHLPTPSWYSLKLRLRRYLIVFDPPTYVLDQEANTREMLTQLLVFFRSWNFTSNEKILIPPTNFKNHYINLSNQQIVPISLLIIPCFRIKA